MVLTFQDQLRSSFGVREAEDVISCPWLARDIETDLVTFLPADPPIEVMPGWRLVFITNIWPEESAHLGFRYKWRGPSGAERKHYLGEN